MVNHPADRYTPTSLDKALKLLATEELLPYAGGTDLMLSKTRNRPFLFLHRIEELKGIGESDGFIRIGAATTYRELLESPLTPAILKEAVASIAAPAIRNVATLGGNIANASPKGDGALICFVTDSLLRLADKDGERLVPIADFYQGRNKTLLKPNELLVEILMPTKWLADYSFHKVGARKALSISRVSFAGLFAKEGGRVAHLALAFGAIEDVVVRRPELDGMLIGKTLPEACASIDDLLTALDTGIKPIRGRVSAEYRKQVCQNLARDFLESRVG